MMTNRSQEIESLCMDQDHEGDSSTRLMMERMQVFHRRLEAETIAGLIRNARTIEVVHAVLKQRLDSLIISEESLADPTANQSRLVQ